MWICSQYGFYSIVEKKPGEFHVRARVRRDLENLVRGLGFDWKIHRSKNADYCWRCVVTQRDVMALLSTLARNIDYSNFKDRIHELPDQREKSSAYANLWSNLYSLQR